MRGTKNVPSGTIKAFSCNTFSEETKLEGRSGYMSVDGMGKDGKKAAG